MFVCTLQESCWESVLGGTHHSSAADRQVSSRGSETRIRCLNNCTMVGPQLVLRSSLVCSDHVRASCLERGENERNVTQESPSGHTKTLTELKLANLSSKIMTNSGRTPPRLPACLAVIATADRLFLRYFQVSNEAPFVFILLEQQIRNFALRTSALISAQRGASCSR